MWSWKKNQERCAAPVVTKSNFQVSLVTNAKEVFVKQYSNQDFDINGQKYPKSLCSSCRLSLSCIHLGSNKRVLPEMPNYLYLDSLLPRPTISRDEEDSCNCYICITGRNKAPRYANKGRGCKKTTVVIYKNNG